MKFSRRFRPFLLAGIAFLAQAAHAQIVTTLAGSGAQGNADGTTSEASFANPQGVAVDAWGNVFVADTLNLEIRKIAPGGAVTTVVTGAICERSRRRASCPRCMSIRRSAVQPALR